MQPPNDELPLCDTTLTPRHPRTNCGCDTYVENMGPCAVAGYLVGMNGKCVFCDHEEECHARARTE